ncbi:MAG: HAMP domain-containing sensor histidine kinase [Caulobacteraceae bacterium]|nr:HAMP domain-containing sensor histidine kinase [Caulobacteraceae bacterium]
MRAPGALRLRLLLALVLVWALGAVAVLAFLALQSASPSEMLEDASLATQARELTHGMRFDAAGRLQSIEPPLRWAQAYRERDGAFYTLYDPRGGVAARSANLRAPLPLAPLAGGQAVSPLRLVGPKQDLAITARAPHGYVLVAARANPGREDLDLWGRLSDFMPALLFVLAALVGLVVAWRVAAWSLRPLERAAREAAAIGPERLAARLTTEGLPTEVLPLAEAVNRGLDRVAEAYAGEKRFTAEAAHALRTPLAVLDLRLQRAEQGGQIDWPAVRADLAELNRLIAGLLALARADRAALFRAPEAVNLSRLVRETAAAVAPRLEAAGRAIEVSAPETPVLATGDAGELREMLFALIDNALVHGAGRVLVALRADAHGAALVVSDEGEGVAPAARERVFERFHKQDAVSPGAGLGLAIVRQTARGHGGEAGFVGAAAIEVRLGRSPSG